MSWSPLAGGWLSGRFGVGKENTSERDKRMPARPGAGGRFDLTVEGNQRKPQIVTELAAETGLTLVELALAFMLEHPAVTAAIIGPRTREHIESQLPVPDIRLDPAVLDRIDEIVPPGTDVNPEDVAWRPPALRDTARRRRPVRSSRR